MHLQQSECELGRDWETRLETMTQMLQNDTHYNQLQSNVVIPLLLFMLFSISTYPVWTPKFEILATKTKCLTDITNFLQRCSKLPAKTTHTNKTFHILFSATYSSPHSTEWFPLLKKWGNGKMFRQKPAAGSSGPWIPARTTALGMRSLGSWSVLLNISRIR